MSDLEEEYRAVKARIKQAQEAKYRAEGELQALQTQLDNLKTEAKAKFGTDDLTELQIKAEDLQAKLSDVLRNIAARLQGISQ